MSGSSHEVQRDVLPIPDRPYEGELPLDAKDPEATFPAIEPLRRPAGAPNVLVILLDDVGFAARPLTSDAGRLRVAMARQ